MATKKTAPFMLTERLTLDTAGARFSDTIDIGSYVDVGDRQGLLVHNVDYIFQGTDPTSDLVTVFGGTSQVDIQVLDLNRGNLVFSNDRALISSGQLQYVATGGFSNSSDMYPDNFGKDPLEGRITVNDSLYVQGIVSQLTAAEAINVTVVITASIVTLSQKDFMAIAIQSTAADN
tara:strand:- start:135 stop:662 length:528 start_codon:yes stop_codon:yes gene_type:complete